jgi:hypothetical protein
MSVGLTNRAFPRDKELKAACVGLIEEFLKLSDRPFGYKKYIVYLNL